MDNPKLSVVVITLNEEVHLPRLLQDLAAQTFSDFEIIHVDSRSDDKTVAVSELWAKRFAQYRIIQMDRRGVSLGRNTGAAVARGQRIVFLDADTRLAPDFFEKTLIELDAKALDVGIVCMTGDGLPWSYQAGYVAFNAGIRFTSFVFPTAVGACLFSTPQVHKAIGGFDEMLSLCEDCDYTLRAFKRRRQSVGLVREKFYFDPRRLKQDGLFATGLTYLHANARRLFVGELHNQEIKYEFGHYARQ